MNQFFFMKVIKPLLSTTIIELCLLFLKPKYDYFRL